MTRRAGARVLVVVLAGALWIAGCGGDDSASGTTTTTTAETTTTAPVVTKAAYVAAANAICKTMNDEVAKVPQPTSNAEAADAYEQVAGVVSSTLVKLRALAAPAADQQAVNAIWAKVDTMLDDYARLIAALRSNDDGQIQQTSQAADASQAAANDASNAYGLTVCGS